MGFKNLHQLFPAHIFQGPFFLHEGRGIDGIFYYHIAEGPVDDIEKEEDKKGYGHHGGKIEGNLPDCSPAVPVL
jgi:hypothetical protein